MKTVIQIIVMVFIINGVNVYAQLPLSKKQIKYVDVQEAFKAPEIPSVLNNIKFINPSSFAVQLPKVRIDLAEQLSAVKSLCPLLHAKTTINLEGDREDRSNVLLQWKVVNGNNSRQFEIERSLGDSLHFETVNVEWPNAKAAAKEKYELEDNNDYKLISYYRVRLLLFSGEVVYSNIAGVKGYKDDKVSIFPNPAVKQLTLYADFDGIAVTAISILDFSGKIIQNQSRVLPKKQHTHQLDVSQLIAGMYSVKIQLADNSFRTVKFIKQ